MHPDRSHNTSETSATAVTIGFFDGLHRGHRHLLSQLTDEAGRRGLSAVAVTFDRHPRQVVRSVEVSLLSTPEERIARLRESGVDSVEVIAFDAETARLTAREFMQQVLNEQLGARLLVTGYDNHFGHPTHAGEGFPDYVAYGKEVGIEVVAAQPLTIDGEAASSSAVRRHLLSGDIEGATRLLGRHYTLRGRVESGQHIGRKLGFPTANVQAAEPQLLIPAGGVYTVTMTADGHTWQGMMNIGTRPTFHGDDRTLEVHLFDFEGNLYQHDVEVAFVARLRNEKAFSSASQLILQLTADREQALQILNTL